MATITADLVEDALVEEGIETGLTIKRVYDVASVESATKSGYIIRAMEAGGLPRLGDRHPERPQCTVRSRRILSSGKDGTGCKVDVTYSNAIGSLTLGPRTLIVEETTALQSQVASAGVFYTRGVGPRPSATVKLFQVNYKGKTVTLEIGYLEPLRTLTVIQVSTKPPDDYVFDLPGFVNNSQWMGKPAGYWLCTQASRVRDFEQPGYIAVKASFLTRIRRNWMEVNFVRRTEDGAVDPGVDWEGIVNTTIGQYQHDVVAREGGLSVGPYPIWPFKQAFGYDYADLFGSGGTSLPRDRGERTSATAG